MALVSVIVPAYNAAAFIRSTLESVCAQTYRDIEVIVVDDESWDNTVEIVQEFVAIDSRVVLLRQPNGGVGAARNAGIRAARGIYIAPIDADDIWHPRKIEEQVACMEEHGESTGMVYCWTNMIDEDGSFLRRSGEWHAGGGVLPILLIENFVACASVPLFRASALAEVGAYLTRVEQKGAQGCEDWDLSLRIAEKYDVYVAPHYLVGYRQINGMSLVVKGMIDSFNIVFRRVLDRNPHISPRIPKLAAAPFYFWLSSRSYDARKFRQCIDMTFRTIVCNLRYLLVGPTYRLMFKSIVRLFVGPNFKCRRKPECTAFPNSIAVSFPPFACKERNLKS